MTHHWGYVGALASAVLFGISSTLNKIALENMNPLVVAGMIYFVGGIVLFVVHSSPLHGKILKLFETSTKTEHEITRRDFKTLALVILFGSVIAPLMLLQGLSQTTAINASFLLSAESFFTVLLAFIFLKERGKRKDYVGIFVLLVGVVFLTTNGRLQELTLTREVVGNLLVLGACLFWSMDNNLSRFLSKKREITLITALKCLIGGFILLVTSLLLGISLHIPLVSLPYILSVGGFSIATSVLLFLFALREIGSMRTGIIYSTASLFGAVFAFAVLGEPFSIVQLLAGLVMLLGIYLLYRR